MAALIGTVAHAEDLTVTLGDGKILIRAKFLRTNEYGDVVPELILKLKNQTSAPWRTLKLQFDVAGFCDDVIQHWKIPIVTGLGWAEGREVVKDITDMAIPLVGKDTPSHSGGREGPVAGHVIRSNVDG